MYYSDIVFLANVLLKFASNISLSVSNVWKFVMVSRTQAYSLSAASRAGVGTCARSLDVKRILLTSGCALLVGISYYLGTRIGFALTPRDEPIATFWPPNAVLLAALLLAPKRMWLAFFLAVFPAHMLAQLRVGVPVLTALGWFISNSSEALLGALCITRYRSGRSLFDSVRGVLAFVVFGLLVAPLATSFLDAASVVITGWGKNYWALSGTRFLTNALAELTLVPAIVLWGTNGLFWIRNSPLIRWVEAAFLAIGTVAISVFVFSSHPGSPNAIPALMYAPLPFLLWATVRFGSGGLSLSLLCIALVSIWNAMHGRGPFTSSSMAENVQSLQAMFFMVATPLLFLSAVIAQMRRMEESLSRISGRLIHAHEEERQRISRELHDDLGQQLALVQAKLEELREASDTSWDTSLADLSGRLSDISTTAHEISYGLYPSHLEHLGLLMALERLCKETGRGRSLSIHLTSTDFSSDLDPRIALCLYRVTQEALHNILAHSRAHKAEIELKNDEQRIWLRIIDDGVGFDPEQTSRAGLGLVSMTDRIKSLGGSIDVKSGKMAGTQIQVSVPMRQPPPRELLASAD